MADTARQRIAIITDSTSDIPGDLVEQYGITVVPQILIMGQETWRDGVEIDPATFYEMLRTSPHFPASSQPSVKEFHDRFVELAETYEGIVAILVSDELSGTINSAATAAASLPQIPIEVIDSRSVSVQLGFIVLAAARAAARGGDLEAVAGVARGLIGRVQVYFIVDTLEYLHRNGRIGAAARLFGTALNIKPVLCIDDGIVTPVAKIRSRRKALERVFDLVEKDLVGGGAVHMAVLHVAAPDEAARLADELEQRFQPVEMIRTECGPVIGTHAGPGTVGVAFYAEAG
jgi:DegV family protein with EDD domain